MNAKQRLAKLVGKVLEKVESNTMLADGTCQGLTLQFSDGTVIHVRSQSYPDGSSEVAVDFD